MFLSNLYTSWRTYLWLSVRMSLSVSFVCVTLLPLHSLSPHKVCIKYMFLCRGGSHPVRPSLFGSIPLCLCLCPSVSYISILSLTFTFSFVLERVLTVEWPVTCHLLTSSSSPLLLLLFSLLFLLLLRYLQGRPSSGWGQRCGREAERALAGKGAESNFACASGYSLD